MNEADGIVCRGGGGRRGVGYGGEADQVFHCLVFGAERKQRAHEICICRRSMSPSPMDRSYQYYCTKMPHLIYLPNSIIHSFHEVIFNRILQCMSSLQTQIQRCINLIHNLADFLFNKRHQSIYCIFSFRCTSLSSLL